MPISSSHVVVGTNNDKSAYGTVRNIQHVQSTISFAGGASIGTASDVSISGLANMSRAFINLHHTMGLLGAAPSVRVFCFILNANAVRFQLVDTNGSASPISGTVSFDVVEYY